MKKRLILVGFVACVLAVAAVFGQTTGAPRQGTTAASVATQSTLINQYCVGCHSEDAKEAGLDSGKLVLENLDLTKVSENGETWEKVVRRLRAGMMPPVGSPRPDAPTYEALTVWLENELDRTVQRRMPAPGLHRLNRIEYANVIRDLLALEVDATRFLPADDSTRGFDNLAGTLGMSSSLLEAYVSAAGKISRMAIGNVTAPTQVVYALPVDTTQNYHVEGLPFGTRGGTLVRHNFPVDGEYAIKVFSVKKGNMGGSGTFGDIRGEKLEISLDGERLGLFDWDTEVQAERGSGEPGTIDLTFPAKAGTHTVGVTFLATNYAPVGGNADPFERTTIETGGIGGFQFFPHVGSVRITGPYNSVGASDTPTRSKIFVCTPTSASQEAACAREIVTNLVRRAFRRPATDEDLESLMTFYQAGRDKGTFDDGIEMALRRILADLEFIYRIEAEPANLASGQAYRVSDVELASRLSFFLWSTIPDDELMNVAVAGRLKEPAVLEQQVRRMLADPRAEALVANFAGQWLNLRGLQASYPVVELFPDFDDNLRQAFWRETELLFGSIVREDRNVLDLLTADYTFVNERLAKHYGIPNVYGTQFRRVTLGASLDSRRGLLGQGSILTTTSDVGRTSPVKRGKWILTNLLGVEPPQPPPNVPELKPKKNDIAGNVKELSMREKMLEHRVRPDCVNCHKLMDPIGFSLENFNAIGMWRTDDEGVPINAADEVYDGSDIDGPAGLRQWLLGRSDQVVRVMTEKLLTYALGRGFEYYDMPLVRQIARDASRNGNRFSSIVLGIVKSEPFQMNMKLQQSSNNN